MTTMVKNYGLDCAPLVSYSVVTWTNEPEDHAAIEHVQYHVNDDGDLIMFAMEDTSTGVVTRSTYIEPGERFIVSPLGWMSYSDEAEELFKRVLGEK